MEPKKYAYIDALRGWAIIGVLLVHIHYMDVKAFAAMGSWFAEGARGVQLFYLVSAFTLMLSWHSRKNDGARNFFIRRFFRIAPAFYLAMILHYFATGTEARFWAPDGINWPVILSTATFTHGLHPHWINALVPGGWSIAVEVAFYCTLPFLVRYITTLERAIIGFVAALGVAAVCNGAWALFHPSQSGTLPTAYAFYWLPNQLPVFLLGILLFFLVPTLQRWRELPQAFAISCGLLLAAWLMVPKPEAVLAFANHVQWSLAFALLTAALLILPHRLLVNRATVTFGQLSYSIYLLHVLFINLVKDIFQYSLFDRYLPGHEISLLIKGAMVIGLSLLAAFVVYRYIELPGIALGKRVIGWLSARSQLPLGDEANTGPETNVKQVTGVAGK